MSERDALRHLTDAKASALWKRGYETCGHVLYLHTDQSFAIAAMGRVRYLSTDQLNALLNPSEAA